MKPDRKPLFKGIVPALLTPFDAQEQVDYDALGQVVECLLKENIGGLFVCGCTGEWWALTQEERMKIVEKVLQTTAGRTKVMVHIGASSTRHAIELAQHARKAGANAVSALPPAGYPFPEEAIWDHFRRIGESTDLPLYLYHLPQFYGDLITIDGFMEAAEKMTTLAGVKFSSYRIDDLIELRMKSHGQLNILSGGGEQLLSAMACGADGSICSWYNIVPRLAGKIIDCVRNNDVAEARKHQDVLLGFARICCGKYLAYLKWLIGLRGISVGAPRKPFPDLTRPETEEAMARLTDAGVFDWVI